MLENILTSIILSVLGGIAAFLAWFGRFVFDFATDVRKNLAAVQTGQAAHMRHSILAAYTHARDVGYVERPALMLIMEIHKNYKVANEKNNGWIDVVVDKLKQIPVKEDI
ncbi:hypothetical protein NO1_1208 [Candidatus Termititenax aidoneus]|uniref:Phage holin n=1 Tax=Termititenax aidoneus TaxID=2218524 RepID=A0A388TB10_TERA1|nr:hypothetical protein NO1_1208 [Candidatus Termititenax aidoneus]